MEIKFGPAGLGSVKEAVGNLEDFYKKGLKACEVAFTYGIYIKKDKHNEEILEIKDFVRNYGIELSVHAPYWINLNSNEKEKIEASKKRILDSVEIANSIGAKRVVFHPGYYGSDKELAYENIKFAIVEMMDFVKKEGWDVELCPEVMGKKNVFGSIDEISRLVDETGCGFCIDFAHVLARYGKYEFGLLKEKFPGKKWHCHFSGIEYGEKGERNHKLTSAEEWEKVLRSIPRDKEIVIINESPDPVGDSVLGLKLFSSRV